MDHLQETDFLDIFPVDYSENNSVGGEPPELDQEEKKKEFLEEQLDNKQKINECEENLNSNLNEKDIALLEERRLQNLLEIEQIKKAEFNSLLQIYDLTTIKTIEYTYKGYVKKEDPLCRHHFGICEYSNGDRYVGQWQNNKKHGLGKFSINSGIGGLFMAEFKDDIQDGYAEKITQSKHIIGVMKNFKLIDDVVILKKENEILFEGVKLYNINKIVAFGKLYEKNENYYCGELHDLMNKNNFGLNFRKNSYIFKGILDNNHRQGYGEYYYPDGSKFIGFFKDDLKHGWGMEFYKDGKCTLAKYNEDYKDGMVILYHKGSTRLELWHLGFKSKVFDKWEANKQFLRLSYPEYRWALDIDYKKLLESLLEVNDPDILQKQLEKGTK